MTLTARLLRVDLSTGQTADEVVPPDVLRTWVGGTGIGVYYLYKEVPPGVEWDDPENRVIIATGPLANTRISGTGTTSAVFKGPMTGLAGAPQANGFLGPFRRSRVYAGLILQGKADKLPRLHIDEDGVRLMDAAPYAGMGVWQMEDKIREDD